MNAFALDKNDQSQLREALTYELAPKPLSLFDEKGLMREADKPKLADLILTYQETQDVQLPLDLKYVIDAGSLIQRIPWKKGTTFDEIVEVYIKHTENMYGKVSLILDGYEEASTKDTTHIRRSGGRQTTEVNISGEKSYKAKRVTSFKTRKTSKSL